MNKKNKQNALEAYLQDCELRLSAWCRAYNLPYQKVWRVMKGAWPSKQLAKKIKKATGGKVTPNDLL